MKYLGNGIMQITQRELDALPSFYTHANLTAGEYYRSVSTADHMPMIVEVYEHPLDGLRTRFYRVKIESDGG